LRRRAGLRSWPEDCASNIQEQFAIRLRGCFLLRQGYGETSRRDRRRGPGRSASAKATAGQAGERPSSWTMVTGAVLFRRCPRRVKGPLAPVIPPVQPSGLAARGPCAGRVRNPRRYGGGAQDRFLRPRILPPKGKVLRRFVRCPIPTGLYHPARRWPTESAYAGSAPESASTLQELYPSRAHRSSTAVPAPAATSVARPGMSGPDGMHPGKAGFNSLGVAPTHCVFSQGSAFRATLGWTIQSLRD
jgi:hypothetical protein